MSKRTDSSGDTPAIADFALQHAVQIARLDDIVTKAYPPPANPEDRNP